LNIRNSLIDPFKTLVPPYSSLYFGNDTLMSDEAVRVINFYKKWAPEFSSKIATETNKEYFKVLSECLNNFINNVKIPAFHN
jgi:acyl-homoserine lactone acylase PvdQ